MPHLAASEISQPFVDSIQEKRTEFNIAADKRLDAFIQYNLLVWTPDSGPVARFFLHLRQIWIRAIAASLNVNAFFVKQMTWHLRPLIHKIYI